MAQSTPSSHPDALTRGPELIDYSPDAIVHGLGVGVEVTISAVCEHVAFGATAPRLFAALSAAMQSLTWPANLARVRVSADPAGRPITLCVIVTQHLGSEPTRVRIGLPRELAALIRDA